MKKIALGCLLLVTGLSYSLPAWAASGCSGQKCSELSGKGKCGKKKGSCEKGGSSEKGSSDHHSS
ncbi:hypothetical protein MAMC_00917 [Methylacidimicrobium cyclopophantes]|uniref:Uncharacterized protein n=1 Tax=Methylacidimicrobium cyclopophantes TaxID=1041766 RepID=A0A5E6MDW3_9BACT|nr:hypothetical protein [Methylacidimicrobium cyclopophantes]VVM06012.1 hypothetical protein MAMC_00917 [Methylacidimicrobium cyclopophantes]